jgi:hypothetical protein
VVKPNIALTPQRKVNIKGLGETTLYMGNNGWDFFIYEKFGFKIARLVEVKDNNLGSEFYFDPDYGPAMMRYVLFSAPQVEKGEDSPYLVTARHWVFPTGDLDKVVKDNLGGSPISAIDDRLKTMWTYMKVVKPTAEIRVFISKSDELLTTGFDCIKQLRRELDAPAFPVSELSAISFNYDLERAEFLHQDVTKVAVPFIMEVNHFASKDEWIAN